MSVSSAQSSFAAALLVLLSGASVDAHGIDEALPPIVTCEPYLFPLDGPDPEFIPFLPTPLKFNDSDSEDFREVARRWQTILHMIANQEVALLRDQLTVHNVVMHPERAAHAYEKHYSDSAQFSFLHHELPILGMARYAWNASPEQSLWKNFELFIQRELSRCLDGVWNF